jgi:autotransporter translocation and assembly factor TamB
MAFMHQRVSMKPLKLTGALNAELMIQGPVFHPQVTGRLEATNGSMKTLAYDRIILNFDGVYPLITLRDSLVTQEQGMTIAVDGLIDLADLQSLSTQVRMLNRSAIIDQGRDGRSWVFKRIQEEDDSMMEMKYLLRKDDRGDTSAVIGIQKSIGF